MNIGIFDSGLGGLIMTMSILEKLPQYNYLYLGDTKRVPYGNRSQETIYEFTQEAVDFLFQHDCQLIIVACNTASAEALRKIQQEYLPAHYPDRRVIGVLVPTAEEAVTNARKIGVLATESTVESGAFLREIKKLQADIEVVQEPAPLLVPLLENDATDMIEPLVRHYLETLTKQGVDTIILGCTHYALLKDMVRRLVPEVRVISQDELLPQKVADYLNRHPEIETKLGKEGRRRYLVTDLNESYKRVATSFSHHDLPLEVVEL